MSTRVSIVQPGRASEKLRMRWFYRICVPEPRGKFQVLLKHPNMDMGKDAGAALVMFCSWDLFRSWLDDPGQAYIG
jgi:hypothetical protein